MAKGIAIFSVLASFMVLSLCGCKRNEPESYLVSSQSSEQDFAKIHKNVDFNKEDTEKMHSLGMTTEEGVLVDMVLLVSMARKKKPIRTK